MRIRFAVASPVSITVEFTMAHHLAMLSSHRAAARPMLTLRPLGRVAPFRPVSASAHRAGFSSTRWCQRHVSLASKAEAKTEYQPTSAKDAIETGLKRFKDDKNYAEAARLFNEALKPEFKANSDEMQAALYNLGCAYTKLKQYKLASDSIVRAINDHRLKLTVALKVQQGRVQQQGMPVSTQRLVRPAGMRPHTWAQVAAAQSRIGHSS